MDGYIQKIKFEKGTSLLELIVATGIFSIVLILLGQIYMSIVEAQRNTIAAQNSQENMRYAFEVISKEIRQARRSDNECLAAGTNKVFNGDNGDTELWFKNKKGECVHYYLDAANDTLMVERDGNAFAATPDEVAVNALDFIIVDNDINVLPEQRIQPRITVRAVTQTKGTKASQIIPLTMQTTISSRSYE